MALSMRSGLWVQSVTEPDPTHEARAGVWSGMPGWGLGHAGLTSSTSQIGHTGYIQPTDQRYTTHPAHGTKRLGTTATPWEVNVFSRHATPSLRATPIPCPCLICHSPFIKCKGLILLHFNSPSLNLLHKVLERRATILNKWTNWNVFSHSTFFVLEAHFTCSYFPRDILLSLDLFLIFGY